MTDHLTSSAVAIEGVSKSFGATKAIDNATFAVERGTVHALLGENGAGKSTTMKLLSGLLSPDHGTVHVNGKSVSLKSPRDAHRCGIQTAFQELTLVDDLTVLENMLLPNAPIGPLGMLRRSNARRDVAAHFKAIGLDVDLDAIAGELDLSVQQKIEIARALYRKPEVLLLDEPTSALSGKDVLWLGEIIANAKRAGITIVFISHRLPEVRQFCDRLTILRNGKHIITANVADVTDDEVVEKIIGRSIENSFPPRPVAGVQGREPVLEVRQLEAGEKLAGVDLTLRPGEIHGVAALQGMGQLDLFSACFGALPVKGGAILIDGQEVYLGSPSDALSPSIGIGFVPEDRKTEGLFLKLNGTANASLPVVDQFSQYGLLNLKTERAATRAVFDAVEVADRALYTAARSFSGGNQQKIAISKWFLAQSRILLLFDPTRGIDVGTKHQLYVLMRKFTDAGGAILFHSTEVPELVHLCDRVSVLYQGRVALRLQDDDISETAIMEAALGGRHASSHENSQGRMRA
ncbi:sugar ABC transporter ATP-binding protein [Rhizobium fabae]|uniref:Ribose transport system ATP-binding protein n=1 Tax=Rhizobium fabae TaxID=573179 RepID=A0A7W6FKY8_9HYPH|nr:sugar ABC transporter ATP-binding protein [Rhizobium fabae]MBB3917630.1 ribose transport system ATP-binding protein [Rhizobium fabae]